jgi:hypothetical protein
VGEVTRDVLERAARSLPRLNGTQWRVLSAVVGLTATYSKLLDSTYVAKIAELADLDAKDLTLKNTKRSLKMLVERGLIEYDPANKHGERTLIGLTGASAQEGAAA